MGRNRKGDRFLLNKTNLDRAFSRPNPNFHDTWMLVYLYATSSDRLSARNIRNAEAYAYRLRQTPDWQTIENLPYMERIDDVILRAKERFANRKTRTELRQEKAERAAAKAEEKLKKSQLDQVPMPVLASDPSAIWAAAIADREVKEKKS